MTTASIPVELTNPGQVFACLGFMEVANVVAGGAEGAFDWSAAKVRFVLRAMGDTNPFAAVLAFLAKAEIQVLAPPGSGLKDQYGLPTIEDDGVFPVSPFVEQMGKVLSIKESVLPLRLHCDGKAIPVSHWADSRTGRDSFKLWGGAGGYSGAARLQDLLNAIVELVEPDAGPAAADPFAAESLASGLRLEMRRDYVPIDVGFSLNAHSSMSAMGYPIVEALAAIGLEHARPRRLKDRLHYCYRVWGSPLPVQPARAVLGDEDCGFESRRFMAVLGEPNQYDRSILSAFEELRHD